MALAAKAILFVIGSIIGTIIYDQVADRLLDAVTDHSASGSKRSN